MRSQLNRRYNGGLLGKVEDYVNAENVKTTYGILDDIFDFGKNNKTPTSTNTGGNYGYYPPQMQTMQNQNTTDFSQYLPIAIIGLLGIGAIMAFKK